VYKIHPNLTIFTVVDFNISIN